MTVIIRGNGDKALTKIVLKPLSLLLGAFALFLVLYHSQWFIGKSEAAHSTRARTPSLKEINPPQSTHFEILYSAKQRGLMLYNGYVYLLRQGDVLPDGGRVREFQLQDGRWVAIRL